MAGRTMNTVGVGISATYVNMHPMLSRRRAVICIIVLAPCFQEITCKNYEIGPTGLPMASRAMTALDAGADPLPSAMRRP
jgi:hypothetical protein